MRFISAVAAIATHTEYLYSAANSEVVYKVLTYWCNPGWKFSGV